MEWVPPLVLLLGVLIVVVPVGVYLGAVALLWATGLFSKGFARSRVRFFCPFKKRSVSADFLTGAGSDRPSDVLSCSAFAEPDRVGCAKACLGLAETHSVSTSLLPRYSLIAGGTAYRVAGSGGLREGGPVPDTAGGRAA
jgi:hypothetical protein